MSSTILLGTAAIPLDEIHLVRVHPQSIGKQLVVEWKDKTRNVLCVDFVNSTCANAALLQYVAEKNNSSPTPDIQKKIKVLNEGIIALSGISKHVISYLGFDKKFQQQLSDIVDVIVSASRGGSNDSIQIQFDSIKQKINLPEVDQKVEEIQSVHPNVPLDGHIHKPGQKCQGCLDLFKMEEYRKNRIRDILHNVI